MKHDYIQKLNQDLFSQLSGDEELSTAYNGEDTYFLRFNGGKVRQSTEVVQGGISAALVTRGRIASAATPVTGVAQIDQQNSKKMLNDLRELARSIPEDPFLVEPENFGKSESVISGEILERSQVADAILTDSEKLDMTGIYAAGIIQAGTANSKGTDHWFETDNFSLDYSLISPNEHMAKGNYSGTHWNQTDFKKNRSLCETQLKALEKPKKVLKPGSYKTYLAPSAVAEIVGTLTYGMSTTGVKQRQSPWIPMLEKGKKISEKITLRENFELGLNTPFNDEGELSPKVVDLLVNGQLKNTLTSRKTAKEYDVPSNGASSHEMLRSPEILSGKLEQERILAEIGQGLYINQLHYLNWSELNAGRLTGMTRYACFYVENGELAAPIENLRFDDSIYNLLGDSLVELTDFSETALETSSYFARHLGGIKCPGMLIAAMNFAL